MFAVLMIIFIMLLIAAAIAAYIEKNGGKNNGMKWGTKGKTPSVYDTGLYDEWDDIPQIRFNFKE